MSLIVAIYTAFLFAQAKGRDFWQSPLLVLHMFVHSIMAGASLYAILAMVTGADSVWDMFIAKTLLVSISINLMLVMVELTITHPTRDAKAVVKMITRGRYKMLFWIGAILFGNIIPLVLLFVPGLSLYAGIIVLIGIFLTEKIWVEAPQRIPLT